MIRFDYPESEGIKLKQIQSLVEGWKAFLLDDEQVLFVSDGFYPHYFSKKPRNLFIGKGALGMAVENYIKGTGLDNNKQKSRSVVLSYSQTHCA